MDLYQLSLAFFLIANPIGNIPPIVALIKNFSFERQRIILFRESIFALLIALFFQFLGKEFLSLLEIKEYTVSLAGGLLLFIVALQMIFPKPVDLEKEAAHKEPFIVPIATPLITGGGLMSTIMLYASLEPNPLKITSALLIAWIGVITVVMLAPYLQRLLGKKGLQVLEQLMGMVLSMLAMEVLVKGAVQFVHSLS